MGVTVQYSLIFFFECFIDHNWTNLDQNEEKNSNSENMLKLFSWNYLESLNKFQKLWSKLIAR